MNYLPFSLLGSESGGQEQEAPDIDVDVLEKEQEDDEEKSPWRVILFDDDIHTFDEVIGQLIKALGCTQDHAEELTYKVHNEGKAEVYKGSFEDCFEVNGVLKEIQLVTEIKG
ncbi:Clp protease ClpS [Aliifodinibius salipaludis]|uniref:Clp protease ClpS n=1 Tax=Fodinibius salipaludis TaxID=2032627 RepID=A0A2A2GAR8_9BACT|nr:ATP-dependent Clp protease adaptor ClpS [Aliifodinibius salipaludis]PAU94836.1 Clp protease ClpS [Aliifodinibius salipaludis]